jgi:hypothetical protein
MEYNRIKIISLFFLLSYTAFGGDESFLILGKKIILERNIDNVLISKNCQNCLALQALVQAPLTAKNISPQSIHHGANPGAINCELNLKGELVSGVNLSKNNRRLNFCLFKDNSLIHANALQ